ncbi:MAG: hypothetical protein LBP70_04085 [Mycoplasmataceae bacterium]|nr:hypothetical protein [Mycoplasmataceae bacterium]
MKRWPLRMQIAGIVLTTIGTLISVIGIIVAYTWTLHIDEDNRYIIGTILLWFGISAFLIEGVIFIIVGSIFRHKYRKVSTQQ